MGRPVKKPQSINVSEFKAKALNYIEEVRQHGNELTLTKHGEPVARVVPVREVITRRRGSLKGFMHLQGDVVGFDSTDDWDALKS
jgi:prevent-host-death family protein